MISSPGELEALSRDLRGSGLLRLKRPESEHREPARVVPPAHQLTRTLALALGPAAAHEAPMIEKEAQAWFETGCFCVTGTSGISPRFWQRKRISRGTASRGGCRERSGLQRLK
jgi:hypothetical protein